MAWHRGPNIINDGLVFYIDPTNPKSYSGTSSGTSSVIKNLISGVKDSTFINATVFDGKSFYFNGTSSYIDCNASNLTKLTVDFWHKGTQNIVSGGHNGLVVKQSAWGIFMYNNNLYLYNWPTSTNINTNINISDNKWRNIVVTFNEITGTPSNNTRIYINGELVFTTTIKMLNMLQNITVGWGNSTNQYAKGNISSVRIYSTILTQSEILKNYDTYKSRYL